VPALPPLEPPDAMAPPGPWVPPVLAVVPPVPLGAVVVPPDPGDPALAEVAPPLAVPFAAGVDEQAAPSARTRNCAAAARRRPDMSMNTTVVLTARNRSRNNGATPTGFELSDAQLTVGLSAFAAASPRSIQVSRFPKRPGLDSVSKTVSHVSAIGHADISIIDGQAAIEFRTYYSRTTVIEATAQGLTSSSVTITRGIDDRAPAG
jgi:hypothetical protein